MVINELNSRAHIRADIDIKYKNNITSLTFNNKMASEQPWRKVLYVKQHYPDNYLDKEQFKKDLKENC